MPLELVPPPPPVTVESIRNGAGATIGLQITIRGDLQKAFGTPWEGKPTLAASNLSWADLDLVALALEKQRETRLAVVLDASNEAGAQVQRLLESLARKGALRDGAVDLEAFRRKHWLGEDRSRIKIYDTVEAACEALPVD